jgi:hypothetical protein
MTSTGDMKPSDVHSEKTGRPIYGAAAEAAKGHLMGAAAANVAIFRALPSNVMRKSLRVRFVQK